ncbi:hypothetical protein A3D14_03765 [Candidatus Saccharibacteria bacterium RIFCSPHIGHO2_02_FULL_47_12]|nr:MAG: hypothetical protein A3D14_03765 [Candidatus Saccharibacteria bacterium RIFCSPHIGHO2_02_FULL_47_12]
MSHSNIEEIVEVPDHMADHNRASRSHNGNPHVGVLHAPKPPQKNSFWRKWLRALHWRHTHLSRPKWFLLIFALLLVIAGAAFGIYKVYKHYTVKPHTETSSPRTPPAPATEASRLTGIEIDPLLNKRPVTGVMIENSKDARPQAGLKDAGVVFEAIAEGGITRFLALFQEAQPDRIGPIRSVRPYYLDFLLPFDGSIAHVGGPPQALSDIKALGVKDLDQFANAGAYERVKNRAAPHNVYSSTAKLDALNASKGFTSSNFTGFTRKKEAASAQPTATKIDLNVSSALYSVHYDYDATTNSYKRSEGGAAHTDEKSGAQITPKVVVALVMTRGIASDGQHTNYGATGSGKLYVFQDGVVTEGSWAKSDRKAQFSFTDSSGQVIALNPGQTWITIVDSGKVTSGI